MKNKILGSSLIIAGTTIGAGMLAMPLTSAKIGFGFSVVILVTLWALMAFTALLYVEVYQKAPRRDAGIASLAEQYFGMGGRMITTASSLLLMYALLTAYTVGGGQIIKPIFSTFGEQAESIAIGGFLLTFGTSIFLGMNTVDGISRFLFSLKILVFGVVLFMLLPLVRAENIGAMPLNYFVLISASPVFFTSFGFHLIIPTINNYLQSDIKSLRLAILIGTAIPLVAYILWELLPHGVFSQSQFVQIIQQNPTLNGLIEACTKLTGSDLIGNAVRAFAGLALVTSFLGVALSVIDCLDDLLKRVHINANRFSLSMLTFVPVLLLAFFQRNFSSILSYAGLISVYYNLLLPVALAMVCRKRNPNLNYRVWGGNISLYFTLAVGIVVFIAPFLIQWGFLPKVAG